MYIYIYIYIHILCMYVYIYIYIHTYIHIYTHHETPPHTTRTIQRAPPAMLAIAATYAPLHVRLCGSPDYSSMAHSFYTVTKMYRMSGRLRV